MTLAMSTATPADSGLLSGLVNTTQQVGAALGLAVLATLATSRSDALLADGDPTAEALTSGYTLAFAVGRGARPRGARRRGRRAAAGAGRRRRRRSKRRLAYSEA